MDGTLIILVLLVLLYVVVFLPRQRQVSRQRAMQSALAIGDEVVTIGGMHGTVVGVDEEAVRLELSPGVEVRFVREAVASRRTPDSPPAGEDGEELDDDGDEASATPVDEDASRPEPSSDLPSEDEGGGRA